MIEVMMNNTPQNIKECYQNGNTQLCFHIAIREDNKSNPKNKNNQERAVIPQMLMHFLF